MLLPVPNPTKSFWLSEPHPLANHRSTDSLPKAVDVAIIGAGYSGSATAYHILKEAAGERPSVLVLEARDACSGASGRNGGHMRPDLYTAWASIEKSHGIDAAASLAAFELQGLQDVLDIVRKEDINCHLKMTRTSDVLLETEIKLKIVTAFKQMQRSGLIDMSDFCLIEDAAEAERLTRVKGALGAVTFTSGHCWPYKLVTQLLQRAVSLGANLQTHTPVLALRKSDDPLHPWLLQTKHGVVAAKKVVLASNAYTAGLVPQFQDKIIPVRGVACHIDPQKGRPVELLTNTYSIRYGAGTYDYLIQREDGSIVVGGAKQVILKDRHSWYHNIDDSALMPDVEQYFDNYMQRTFSGWEDSEARATTTWSGIMGYSHDDHPLVGPVPGMTDVFITAGFTGHGMPRILACSKAVAHLITGKAATMADTSVPWPLWISPERMHGNTNDAKEAEEAGTKGLASLVAGEAVVERSLVSA